MRLLPVLLAVLFAAGAAHAQTPGSPRWIVDRYLDPAGFAEMSGYVERELAFADPAGGPEPATLGQVLPLDAGRSLRTVQESDTLVVFGLTIAPAQAPDAANDVYLYVLDHESGWHLDALLGLGFPESVYVRRDELAARPAPRADSLDAELRQLRLMTALDAELRAFASEHRERLDGIAQALRDAEPGVEPPAVTQALRELALASAVRLADGSVRVVVGEAASGSVGFLWLPDGVAPPAMAPTMAPGTTILVESVGGGWVLYKTT